MNKEAMRLIKFQLQEMERLRASADSWRRRYYGLLKKRKGGKK